MFEYRTKCLELINKQPQDTHSKYIDAMMERYEDITKQVGSARFLESEYITFINNKWKLVYSDLEKIVEKDTKQ